MTYRVSIRFLLLVIFATLSLQRDASAKCGVLTVVVDGEVRSESKDVQVLIRLHANRGKKTSETVVTPEANRFHVEKGFDTFVSVNLFGSHNCSRRPTAVDTILLVDGSAKQTVKLSFERDFERDEKLFEWRLKTPLVLSVH